MLWQVTGALIGAQGRLCMLPCHDTLVIGPPLL